MAAPAVATPARSETRAPQINRASRSRPNSSVPSQCPAVSGGRNRLGVSTASGSPRGRCGARMAAPAAPRMTRKARTASRFLTSRLFIVDARIEVHVEQIDGELHEDEGQRDDDD